MEPVSLKDTKIIARQLGRPPRGLVAISKRCVHGYPQVVTVYPLLDGKPFPTLYWLTCPFLSRVIASLEADGMIGRLEEEVRRDPNLAARLARAHRSYIEERMRLLSRDDIAFLEENAMLHALLERGIGGIADFTRIKCLHLHVAHALVRENPIGEAVLKSLTQHECPPGEVICALFQEERA
ncbi:MAG: DUF501 domain-containing protein [Candidatus Bipolaricaulota bacterium]|nr:DUF501 domain-containing protein [Candidatus Bipolaricaulota bacterium]